MKLMLSTALVRECKFLRGLFQHISGCTALMPEVAPSKKPRVRASAAYVDSGYHMSWKAGCPKGARTRSSRSMPF
eukprot:4534810-Amphidinium_carterae.1